MISVIIPIYNEEKILERNASFFQRLSMQVELIFVDGGSIDRSVELAESYSKVLRCEKGRARQMNYGAEKAQHDTLLLLHADATLSAGVILSIEKQLSRNGHGRTTTFLAAYFIHKKGVSVDEALAMVKERRPSAHLNGIQEAFLKRV